MKDRIKKIVETENISFSKFAEILDFQRSGISHIVNGRNKPSLEIVQKILENFDYINSEWLLFGRGPMKKDNFIEKQGDLFSDNHISESNKIKESSDEKNKDNSLSNEILEKSSEKIDIKSSEELNISIKEVEKIVIFYSDKSFGEYKPE